MRYACPDLLFHFIKIGHNRLATLADRMWQLCMMVFERFMQHHDHMGGPFQIITAASALINRMPHDRVFDDFRNMLNLNAEYKMR